MKELNNAHPLGEAAASPRSGYSRRNFLGVAGLLLGAGALGFQSCKKDDDDDNTNTGVNLGSGDTGVLNYAYALEQLEAAFYTMVLASPYNGMNQSELILLTDIRDHEVAHREFFKAVLGGSAIQDLEADFSSINFGDRAAVLGAARSFEDLGVQAYNGAGKLLTSADNLTLAGKIVSVEARHAAYIRELLAPGSFADTTIVRSDTRGDYSKSPSEVLSVAGTYIKTKINASNLPTT